MVDFVTDGHQGQTFSGKAGILSSLIPRWVRLWLYIWVYVYKCTHTPTGLVESSFRLSHKMLWKNPNEVFGQSNIYAYIDHGRQLRNKHFKCQEKNEDSSYFSFTWQFLPLLPQVFLVGEVRWWTSLLEMSHAFSWLDEAHPQWEVQSPLLKFYWFKCKSHPKTP